MTEPFQVAALVFCALMALYSMMRGHPIQAVVLMSGITALAAFIVATPG